MIEVRETLELLRNAGAEDVIPLQCTSAYPAPLESLNIGVIERYAREFDLPAGLSDHSLDPVIAPVTAVGIGASVIEKHFTLDKNMEGPDHQFALEPDGLARLVAAVRDAEKAVGSENKTVDIVERELHDIARRRIHATSDITVGETLTKDNIAVLRSGKNRNGLEPKFYEEILGMTAVNMINVGDGVLWEDLEFDIKSGGA
jgi:N-acetylneuraminate synthase